MPALNTATGAKHARIYSVGSYRPKRVVTNAEVCELIDSSDEWIRERSGITERRWAGEGESVVYMAAEAAKVAIERSGISAADIGLIMLATVSHPYAFPSAAVEVGDLVGARGAPAFDLSAACAGFCFGVGMAADLIRGGSAKFVLVIGVERLTDYVDKHDRGTAFIFADGAGAVVIGPSESAGIGPTVWGGDGSQKDAITVNASLTDYRDGLVTEYPTAVMAGQQVFRWAVSEMPKAINQALEVAGITAADLDAFIPHQANNRITDALIRALDLPANIKVARDIITAGNTSAASVPLAMDAMLQSGEAKSGDTALLVGFGSGLVHAAQVVTLP